jgi:hypothetical protein
MKTNQRIADKIRGAIESAIVELAAERDRIDKELQSLVTMLGVGKTKSASKTNGKAGRKDIGGIARSLLDGADAKTGITSADLSERTGQSRVLAGQTLNRLVAAGAARRIGKGRFVKTRST